MITGINIDEKSNKLKHKAIKTALETLERHGFLTVMGYDKVRKIFKIKVGDIKTKELIQSLDFSNFD